MKVLAPCYFCITFEFKHAWSGALSFGQFWTRAPFDLRTHQSWATTKLFDRQPPHYWKSCSIDDTQIPKLCSLFGFRKSTRRDASIINLICLSQVYFFFPLLLIHPPASGKEVSCALQGPLDTLLKFQGSAPTPCTERYYLTSPACLFEFNYKVQLLNCSFYMCALL